jgi:adenylate cyclase class IV
MKQIEVEIKSLLQTKGAADKLLSRMRKIDEKFRKKNENKQLNHYFTKGNLKKLHKNILKHIPQDKHEYLKEIIEKSQGHSVRTRKADEDIIFVIKATVDETTSSNGTARLEFETLIPNSTLDELDNLILNSDFEYQAKWSRERQEYLYKDYVVSIDKNAGYGYLAEFERILSEQDDFNAVKEEIRREMELLGIAELQQDRLARMFDYYNKNWPDYYGTEKTFTIL